MKVIAGHVGRSRSATATRLPSIDLVSNSCCAVVNFDNSAFSICGPRLRLLVPLSMIEFDGIPCGPCRRAAIGDALPTMIALRLVLYQASETTFTVWNAPV